MRLFNLIFLFCAQFGRNNVLFFAPPPLARFWVGYGQILTMRGKCVPPEPAVSALLRLSVFSPPSLGFEIQMVARSEKRRTLVSSRLSFVHGSHSARSGPVFFKAYRRFPGQRPMFSDENGTGKAKVQFARCVSTREVSWPRVTSDRLVSAPPPNLLRCQ